LNSTDLSLFDQCYNAQAVVAEGSLLVVASGVAQAPNDKQQLEPMLAKTSALPEELGQTETMLADNGYFSEANVKACPAAGVERLIALGRMPIINPCASVLPMRRRQKTQRPWKP
jgi:hypothetical protein